MLVAKQSREREREDALKNWYCAYSCLDRALEEGMV